MRPPSRLAPREGQESVWDYPRPPVVEPTSKHLQVVLGEVIVADTRRALRVLETSQAPAYYFPPGDVQLALLRRSAKVTECEWKGTALHYDVVVGERIARGAAWSYPEPTERYHALAGLVAFYPAKVDACLVDGAPARPMPAEYYGGWVTPDVVGPFAVEQGEG
jgi:uncharacterized protein (DUF427 family)